MSEGSSSQEEPSYSPGAEEVLLEACKPMFQLLRIVDCFHQHFPKLGET